MSTSDLLTDDDLQELTGYTYPSKQAEFLASNGINYLRRRDGKVRTTWYNVNHPNGHRADPTTEPDFSQIA
ncbi:MAG TPA: hypothetical protein DCZ12_12175 [Gammaproteobacteria bacterium]|nr:hypothetical protein [Gammaproteobacteria bacterium]